MWDSNYGGFVNNLCVNLWLIAMRLCNFYASDKLILLQYIYVLDYVPYYVLLCVNLFE